MWEKLYEVFVTSANIDGNWCSDFNGQIFDKRLCPVPLEAAPTSEEQNGSHDSSSGTEASCCNGGITRMAGSGGVASESE
jgi:hypothetical protein